jgi:GTP-binding protein EngB required for normal cell division
MGKVRAALKKPRLPFLVVVTKMDKVQAADTKATRRDVVRRISAALPDLNLLAPGSDDRRRCRRLAAAAAAAAAAASPTRHDR